MNDIFLQLIGKDAQWADEQIENRQQSPKEDGEQTVNHRQSPKEENGNSVSNL